MLGPIVGSKLIFNPLAAGLCDLDFVLGLVFFVALRMVPVPRDCLSVAFFAPVNATMKFCLGE